MSGKSKMGGRRIIIAMFTIAAILGAGAAFAYEGPPQDGSCNGAFQGNPEGSLGKTATRDGVNLPNGSNVAPGDKITFTFTWDITDWLGLQLDKLVDCFAVNGVAYNSLDYSWKPTDNDGTQSHTVTVPDLNSGDKFCDRARLSGQPAPGNPSTQKSNQMCFTIGTDTPSDDGGTDGTPSDDGQTDGTPSDDGQTDGTPTDDGSQTDGTPTDGTPTDGNSEQPPEVLGRPPLTKTGSETVVLAAFGILFLTAGGLFTVISRRKESEEIA